jgi:hypothetical protein
MLPRSAVSMKSCTSTHLSKVVSSYPTRFRVSR